MCCDHSCTEHSSDITQYCDDIIRCLTNASIKTIPKCKPAGKRVPGWNDEVKPYRDDSIFWNSIWKQCGSPATGAVAQIRKRTNALYHKAIRQVRARRDRIVADKMAESLCSNAGRDLWIEAKKINSSGKPCPSNVDGQIGDDAISSVFADNYKSLYNSVSFSPGEMCNLEIEISQHISDKCCTGACKSPHAISGESVREAIGYLKADKCDGILSTDHILNGCSQLVIHLSMLFSGMVRHGFSPPSMVLSTVIPIPKNARKSANDSSNYRVLP